MNLIGAAYVEFNENSLIIKKINGKNKEDIEFLKNRIREWADFHDWVLKYELI